MKIAASTPNGDTHLVTQDGANLNALPENETLPGRLLQTRSDGTVTLSSTGAVRNIISRVVHLGEPADADLNALLDEAEVHGAPADEMGEVPNQTAERFTDSETVE